MALPHSPSNASRLSITPCTTEHALHMCSQTMRAPSMSGSCVNVHHLEQLAQGRRANLCAVAGVRPGHHQVSAKGPVRERRLRGSVWRVNDLAGVVASHCFLRACASGARRSRGLVCVSRVSPVQVTRRQPERYDRNIKISSYIIGSRRRPAASLASSALASRDAPTVSLFRCHMLGTEAVGCDSDQFLVTF